MISFVGSGPGDLELITAKGQRRLQEADVVIYDRLVNPLLLFHCSKTCQFIYVGKMPYVASMKQTEINQLLTIYGNKNQRVVRLKGGDPAIFGRLLEELAVCKENHISFEVIPGITAASGTAVYNGMPLTERGQAQSVTFMTGRIQTSEENHFPVMGKNQTICLYMGVETLKKFIPHLINHGFLPDTKICAISWGTYGRQQKAVGTLLTIEDLIEKQKITNPAMIIVGEVVSNEVSYNWFQQLPKYGQRVLLVSTRSPEISELIAYTEKGADVWWQQVGEKRDLRFDSISERYLAEQSYHEVIFVDKKAKELYQT
ncbi:uroporphyrinogen-III C-methyltransferase [Enterococcus sp. AZ103]|uniref:uroporphyrinogen-III C-methyltransferase n=1 Tax=Enterococcus sp. AZ103 TaxID=2774628 RepID=UPI003F27671B